VKNLALLLIFLVPFTLQAGLKKVAIIGGGMGGVSTATFLKDSNYEVHLFEKEKRLGGHATTVSLRGINVDIGPQYLAKGGWDLYIEFLKHFNLFDKNNFYKFVSDITIYKTDQEYPEFTSGQKARPNLDWLMNKKQAIPRLMSVATFINEAYKFNKKYGHKNVSMGDYLSKTKIKEEYLENIIKPLVATGLTSPANMIDEVSMISAAGVLGFRKALKKQEWWVSKTGMQPFIEKIAERAQRESKNLKIHLSSPVTKVLKNDDGSYTVFYGENQEMKVDKLVFAVHVPVLKELLKDWDTFRDLWEEFPYTFNKVLIIDDPSYLHPVYKSFYNVKIQDDGTYSMGMYLNKISPEFGHLIKTWGFSEDTYNSLKEKGLILAEADFMHPLPTTGFLEALKELKKRGKEEGDITFAGGWSENWETQYNAIQSGFKAARAIDSCIEPFWKEKLPALKGI